MLLILPLTGRAAVNERAWPISSYYRPREVADQEIGTKLGRVGTPKQELDWESGVDRKKKIGESRVNVRKLFQLHYCAVVCFM